MMILWISYVTGITKNSVSNSEKWVEIVSSLCLDRGIERKKGSAKMVTCEICDNKVSTYSLWLDNSDNSNHISCGGFDCDVEFDSDNNFNYIDEITL